MSLALAVSITLADNVILLADASWLATNFFTAFSETLEHSDIGLTNPADAPFLTRDSLDKLDWGSHFQGGSWRCLVQAAVEHISLEAHFKLAMQRYPHALQSAGVHAAGELLKTG